MKPMIILPPDVMDAENIAALRENGICVVVAKDPAKVRFVDPIPAVSSRTQVEHAAIQLSRKILNRGFWSSDDTRKLCAANYIDILMKGTPLDPNDPIEERCDRAYENEKILEAQRMAREDARAERAAKKLEQQKAKEEKK